MPLKRFRLTGFCAASKLFFTASEPGLQIVAAFHAPPTAREAEMPGNPKKRHMTNRITRLLSYCSICLLLLALVSTRAGAQAYPEPVREQLLNGLTVLFSQRPGDPNVLIKLRIES
ncbi:MAG: hypothetical protein QOH32_4596, partial [Bradyrhizobium sp.]|nr:hypothetical protein [Bradyrhizobium sp.]